MSALPPSAQKVQQALQALGYPNRVLQVTQSARTAAEAAQVLGCDVAQIAKSLIFRTRKSKRPILVIASGAHRVDEKKLRALVGEKIGKADADFVREVTGYVIGGVPPLGHVQPIPTYIDSTLLEYETLWAAAGTPHSLFQLTPHELLSMTGGEAVDIAADK